MISRILRRRGLALAGCTALLLIGTACRTAQATPYVLLDGNSRIDVDTDDQKVFSTWFVEGVNHLNEFSNWGRIGAFGAPEISVHLLNKTDSAHDTNGDGDYDRVSVNYVFDSPNPFGIKFTVDIDYGLNGGPVGSGWSSMGECVRITNQGTSSLTFSCFEYLDLNLNDTKDDDQAFFRSDGQVVQTDPFTYFETSWGTASHKELDLDFSLQNTLGKLLDAVPTDLTDTPGVGTVVGLGDVAFAMQYDFVIPPGQSAEFCKSCFLQMNPVPEPSAWVLATMAAVGLLVARRRKAAC